MRIVLILAALGIVTACSGGGSTSGSSTTGGPITGGSASGGSAATGGSTGTSTGGGSTGGNCDETGGACSSLANGAAVTNVVDVASVSPAPSGGGAPPDGTYYLTSVLAYTGDGGATGETSETFQATIQISGSGTEFNQVGNHDGCPYAETGSISFGATDLSSLTTCPMRGAFGSMGYSSSSTTLSLFSTDQSPEGTVVQEIQVLTLQQP